MSILHQYHTGFITIALCHVLNLDSVPRMREDICKSYIGSGTDPKYKKILQVKKRQLTENWARYFNRHSSKEIIKCPINTWKGAQHHYSFSSVQFSHSVVSNTLRPNESYHTRPPCPSHTPRVHSNSCPSSQWCHPAISSSVVLFSSCPQSLPASGSFPMSQLFAWDGQSIGVSASASVLAMNTQDWSPLGWTGWISLQSKALSRVFCNTTVQKHKFFCTQLSSQSNSHIHTWPLEKP